MAASSALPLVLVIPAPLGSTRFSESLIGWYTPAPITASYRCLAVLYLATAVCVGPRPPICNFKLEVGKGLTRSFD
eukprot:802840-Pelagomonas_calceolata.AAC.1